MTRQPLLDSYTGPGRPSAARAGGGSAAGHHCSTRGPCVHPGLAGLSCASCDLSAATADDRQDYCAADASGHSMVCVRRLVPSPVSPSASYVTYVLHRRHLVYIAQVQSRSASTFALLLGAAATKHCRKPPRGQRRPFCGCCSSTRQRCLTRRSRCTPLVARRCRLLQGRHCRRPDLWPQQHCWVCSRVGHYHNIMPSSHVTVSPTYMPQICPDVTCSLYRYCNNRPSAGLPYELPSVTSAPVDADTSAPGTPARQHAMVLTTGSFSPGRCAGDAGNAC
jgi:hypothetical protein